MDFYKRIEEFFEYFKTPAGQKIGKILRYVFLVLIIGFIFYQLSGIGWQKLWDSMPTNPLFYVLFFLIYFTLPMTEQYIYRMSLNFGFWEGFKLFIRKKILNQEVVGYSGEAFVYVWAKNNLNVTSKKILSVIKDNTIVSSITSTLTAFILLGWFMVAVNVNIFEGSMYDKRLLIGGGVILAIILITMIVFRNKILSVDKKTARKMFIVHELRIIWVYTLEVLQWVVVMPHVSIYVWFTFLSLRIISSRIPLLPNRDLIFLSASAGIAKYVQIDEASIVGMIAMSSALTKVVNLSLFVGLAMDKDRKAIENIEMPSE